MSLKNIKRVT